MNSTQQLLSEIVVFNKYAKYRPDLGRRETWEEIIDRYLSMMKKKYPYLSNEIDEYGKDLYNKKVLPSMRALQFAGPAIERSETRIYNCAFAPVDSYHVFGEVMFLLLGGTGLGYSVQRNDIEKLPSILKPTKKAKYLIDDSINGWADSVKYLMKAYFGKIKIGPRFDYSDIRAKGERLITAGGKAPGPEPLRICLTKIESLLSEKRDGDFLTPFEVHRIMCLIADAVLSGGIRRAALISLFSLDDKEMATCKHGNWWELYPELGRANNSANLDRRKLTEKDFMDLWKTIEDSGSGEPGFYLSSDDRWGSNPCCEIALRPYQFCNLVELNGDTIESQEDFESRVRTGAFFGTLQAGFTDFHYLRPIWRKNTEKDALIGIGITGIGGGKLDDLDLKSAARVGVEYNVEIADRIGINRAARVTTVKPSGCRPATSDSLVTTQEGIFTLPELFKDHDGERFSEIKQDLTVAINGNKLVKTFNNGIAPVFEIELEGQITLKSTANHPWFVKSSYKNNRHKALNDFVSTDRIKPNDVLDVNLNVYEGTICSLEKINVFGHFMMNTNTDITFPEFMTNDLAWLIGYIDGDGTIDPLKGRFRFVDEHLFNLQKVQRIFKELFNLECNIFKQKNNNAYVLEKASVILFEWFVKNDFVNKYKEYQTIAQKIRQSKKEHILSYFAGLIDSDGCVRRIGGKIGFTISQKEKPITRHWQQVALCVGIHMNHSLNKARDNSHSKQNMILLSNTGFSVHDSMVLLQQNSNKLSNETGKLHSDLNSKPNQILGKVKSVTLVGEMPTYDVEVENDPWFYAGAIKSHNTSSCVLECSSGIHAWHSKKYIRNMQCKVGDDIYNFFTENHPELIQVMDYDPNSAVIGIPQIAPETAVLREDETAIQMLERVRRFNLEWVREGHISGPNTNNVSATVSIKPDEWEEVGKWMWEHRNDYNGLSVLPFDGGTYANAPFEEVDEETFQRKLKYISENDIDLTQIKEEQDNTVQTDTIACAGGSCEII